MFRCLILIYGLSLADAYTIKISGQVELGSKLSQLFKEFCSQFAESQASASESPPPVPLKEHSRQPLHQAKKHDSDDDIDSDYSSDKSTEEIPKKRKNRTKRNKKNKEVNDLRVLDKMKENSNDKLQDKKKGQPLNNLNL